MAKRSSRIHRGAKLLRRRWRGGVIATLALGAVVVAGCGTDTGGGNVAADNAPEVDTKGVPRALAANIRQANVLIDSKGDLLEKKLKRLRGHPVVVNQWASWCEPCRFEIPFFVSAANTHKSTVAFLGIDMQDKKGDASSYLGELPMPYPSIFDPSASYIGSLGGGRVSPTTVFIDAKGKTVDVHEGVYPSLAPLNADIEKFLKPSKSS